jgi:N-acetylated-alpha-linked acidic dipeptidase
VYRLIARTVSALPLLVLPFAASRSSAQTPPLPKVFGYTDFTAQQKLDDAFLAVPDAKLAGEHLKTLTAAPHWASSPEDYKTALYVADKFKAAGLQTEIVPFSVWLNRPVKIEVTAFDKSGKLLMHGPTPEHVDPKAYGGDPFQNDPRILPAFNGSSGSGDVTADVVYANYGTLADFKQLAELGVDVKGKIVLVRYGSNFRGIKVELAQQRGAAGVLIYSDPADDGYGKGDMYPRGPYRPETAVQRGSVQFLPLYSGDPQTPGIASTPDLPASQRITDPAKLNQPVIPSNPLSYHDAEPILQALDGPSAPREWQGRLPFNYHLGGTGAVKVHMNVQQDYKLRTIWDVIGTIPGDDTASWVVAGNHRDAWVFGAVDPNSGTAAMLEAVHGIGALLKQGWKPKRTIKFASWDAEEEGLIGSTEWAELHAPELAHAVAYFNTDVGVSGPDFSASAEPSLRAFVRQVTMEVPSPKGGTVYEQWLKTQQEHAKLKRGSDDEDGSESSAEVRIGTLGSGSDYTPFLQHLGVPSSDIGSDGPYGVYHSAFDNYNWFIKNADPTFVYEQQMARVFGLEVLHMADTYVLPYDYLLYGHDIARYVETETGRAGSKNVTLDFRPAEKAAKRLDFDGQRAHVFQSGFVPLPVPVAQFNTALRDAETALLNPAGLPKRPWFKHTIFAPGEYTGYAAVVLPGVTEAIENGDATLAQQQLDILTTALNNAAAILESVTKTK